MDCEYLIQYCLFVFVLFATVMAVVTAVVATEAAAAAATEAGKFRPSGFVADAFYLP